MWELADVVIGTVLYRLAPSVACVPGMRTAKMHICPLASFSETDVMSWLRSPSGSYNPDCSDDYPFHLF